MGVALRIDRFARAVAVLLLEVGARIPIWPGHQVAFPVPVDVAQRRPFGNETAGEDLAQVRRPVRHLGSGQNHDQPEGK